MPKVNQNYINSIVKQALKEDLGPNGDITTKLISFKNKKTKAKIIAHPECPPDVIKASDFAGSTSGMVDYVNKNKPKKVMLVTECSMSDNVEADNPDVEFVKPCNLCPYMKKINLEKILIA